MEKSTIMPTQQTIKPLLLISLYLLTSSCKGGSVNPQTLSSEQARLVVEEAASICLEVNEDVSWYEEGEVADSLEELFTRLGLDVVQQGQDCDLAVSLQISGDSEGYDGYQILNEDNIVVDTVIVEPKASATGELSITLNGYAPIKHEIDNQGVLKSDVNFYPQVLEQFTFFWGSEVYRQAMHVESMQAVARDALIALGDEGVRIIGQLYLDAEQSSMSEVRNALEILGPDAVEFVPYAIEALGDGKKRLVDPLGFLRAFSGEDFGLQAEAWSDWWDSQ